MLALLAISPHFLAHLASSPTLTTVAAGLLARRWHDVEHPRAGRRQPGGTPVGSY